MNDFFVLFIVYGVLITLIAPILTFLHELGHAVCALILTNGQVDIRMGNFENEHVSFKIGRLEVYLNKFSPWVGFTYWSDIPQEKYKRIIVYLGGPIASALVVFIFSYLVAMTDNIFIRVLLCSFLFGGIGQFMTTIIPMEYKYGPYKGIKSDGYNAIRIMKEETV